MIDGRNFFEQTIKIDLRTYDYIKKIATGQGDDYTTGCLLLFFAWRVPDGCGSGDLT